MVNIINLFMVNIMYINRIILSHKCITHEQETDDSSMDLVYGSNSLMAFSPYFFQDVPQVFFAITNLDHGLHLMDLTKKHGDVSGRTLW